MSERDNKAAALRGEGVRMGAKVIGPACLDILTGRRDRQGVTDIDRWRDLRAAEKPPVMARGYGRLFTPSELMLLAAERTVDAPAARAKHGAS